MRELIISGTVRPGEFLRLEPIAETIGVSITPVREGLRSLQNEGFVRLVPRRGFVVESFTRQDVRDIFWAQAKLAGELAARAADKISAAQLQHLRDVVRAYEKAFAGGNMDGMATLGHRFHAVINTAADSPRLARLLGTVANQLPTRFYATIDGQGDDTLGQHPRVLSTLKDRAPEDARTAMEEHILEGADHLVDTLTIRGVWSHSGGEAEDSKAR